MAVQQGIDMRFLKIFIGMALSGALLACGGGGGNASAPGTTTTGGAAVASVDVSTASAQLGTAVGDSVGGSTPRTASRCSTSA